MGDCDDTIRELDTFLDGEMPDHVRTHIHAHLDGCVDCLQAFDFHAELKLVIQRKCQSDEMPAGLMDRIRECFDADLGLGADPSGRADF